MYGLVDAPRCWFDTLSNFLKSRGCFQSELDPFVFYFRSANETCGVLAVHVEDMVFGGTEAFKCEVMDVLQKRFPLKHLKENGGDFLGKNLKQDESGDIYIRQKEYAENIECIHMSKERRRMRESPVTDSERREMRGALGELNWLSVSTRPDLSASCSLLQQRVADARVEDLIEVNKLIAVARDFSCMEIRARSIPIAEVELCTWSDASWANAISKKSQGGYIVSAVTSELRQGRWSSMSPWRWKSFKQERQVASTLGAEMLSLGRAISETKWMRSLWMEATRPGYKMESDKEWAAQVPITMCLDSKPVYDHLMGQMFTVKDKRLAIEMLISKKEVQRENITIKRMPTYAMLADVLTKHGAPPQLTRRVLKEGRMIVVENEEIKKWSCKKNT